MTNPAGEVIKTASRYYAHATNNQAEYNAVKLATEELVEFGDARLEFYLDSELVVRQLTGVYKIKAPELRVLANEIKAWLDGHDYTFTHVYREKNQLADKLVNETIDLNI